MKNVRFYLYVRSVKWNERKYACFNGTANGSL